MVLLHDRHRQHRGVEGKERPGVVGDDQAAAVGRDVANALRPIGDAKGRPGRDNANDAALRDLEECFQASKPEPGRADKDDVHHGPVSVRNAPAIARH